MTSPQVDNSDGVPRCSMQALVWLFAAALSAAWLTACGEEKKSVVQNVDPEEFPTMRTTDVSTVVSDSGYTRYHLTSDLWLMFDEAKEPHWSFPDGIFMERYDDDMNVEATFRADSATYFSQIRKWRFDGNVRMRNVDGDRFATEQLFWDQQEQKVYSDSFVHIERVDRIIEGYGFESNEEMTEYTVLNVAGIFPTPEKKERQEADSVQPDSAAAAAQAQEKPKPRAATPPPPAARSQRQTKNADQEKMTVLRAQ